MSLRYCITIPVYNEEKRIDAGVTELWTFLRGRDLPARIDIADNGSTDSTRARAAELCARLENVTLTHVSAKGVGLALQESWARAEEPYVGYMDVDLSTRLEHFLEVDRLLRADPSLDVVNGSRLLPDSRVVGRSLKREISSRGFNFLLKSLLKARISDGMCGFKFLKRTAYERLRADGLVRHDWFFNTELLIRAEWAHMNLKEIGVEWHDDPHGSNVKIVGLARDYLRSILALRKEHDARGKPTA